MPSERELLAECAANPDDDAPRLVWADHVGGERGELVVIQCDLARGDLAPAAARVRRVRERELLERHAIEWAGDLVRVAKRWSFRRGFVEAARFNVWTSPSEWPLLRSVTVDHWMPGKCAGIEQVRALGITFMPEEALPALDHVRALAVQRVEDRHVDDLVELLRTTPIETLRLRNLRASARATTRLLEAADRALAVELAPNVHDDIAAPVDRPLRALQLGAVRVRSLAQLTDSVAATTLRRFGFELRGDPIDLADILSSLAGLRAVEVGGNAEPAVRAVIDARLPALRSVRIRGDVSPTTLRALDERYDLELVDVTTIDEELVHETEMLVLGPPHLAWSQPAVFARLDRPEIFDIPAFDASDHITLGRSTDNPIRLMSGSVARRHARLSWRDHAHHIQDLHSTNGVIIGRERIQHAALADGTELRLGDITLRYFIGEGARDRAVAAISG